MDIYLDNSATTKVFDEVADMMMFYLKEEYGNASALYGKGIQALRALTDARRTLAKSIGAEEGEITFTSGGTEGNNILLQGLLRANRRRGNRVLVSKGEHPAVLETLKAMEKEGFQVIPVDLKKTGEVDLEALSSLLTDDTVLVSIMHVNNETGAVNDLKKIRSIIGKHVLFHSDGVQAYEKVPFDVRTMEVDAYTMSSHKICGPKGVGALYLRKGVLCQPLLYGGGQERGFRSGTENIPGIAGFARAVSLFEERKDLYHTQMKEIKETLRQRILAEIPDTVQNGSSEAPHVLNISFLGVKGEVLLHALEGDGISVSTGSACSSKKAGSHVLSALGCTKEEIEGAIRFSVSPHNNLAEVEPVLLSLKRHVPMLRKLKRR